MLTYVVIDEHGNDVGLLARDLTWQATHSCTIFYIRIESNDVAMHVTELKRPCTLNKGDILTLNFNHKDTLKQLEISFSKIEDYKSIREILGLYEHLTNIMIRIQREQKTRESVHWVST